MTVFGFGVILFLHSNGSCGRSAEVRAVLILNTGFTFNRLINKWRCYEIILKKRENRDISADTLRKLVKNKGDECVSGFVRFKKVKSCKGFKDAEDKASVRLSKIHAGRPLEDGSYAAVIRFRLIVWLIPLIILLALIIGFMIRSSMAGAMEIETESQTEYHRVLPIPDITEPAPAYSENRYAGLYINVPGYSDSTIDGRNRGIMAYNPEGNRCVMKYEFYDNEKVIAQSGILSAGMAEYIDIYDILSDGESPVTIVARAYSEDGKTEFNPVQQTVKIVKK